MSVSGVSPPFDSDFRGSSIAESLYLSESLRPITPEFNLFFARGEFVEQGLRVFIRVRGRGLKKFGARGRLEERES